MSPPRRQPDERHRPADPPKVAVSACLLGHAVRYDGGHKHAGSLLAQLDPFVSWVPICPEVGAGFGTPREPVHLERRHGRLRVLGNHSGADGTEAMESFARREIQRLRELGIAGCVLKARSPSCGLHDVRHEGETPRADGRGLFAERLTEALPGLPVADEVELREPAALDRFLVGVGGRSPAGEP